MGIAVPDYLKELVGVLGEERLLNIQNLCSTGESLYITNQRIVFQATKWGFDKTYRYLTAITPYSNACRKCSLAINLIA